MANRAQFAPLDGVLTLLWDGSGSALTPAGPVRMRPARGHWRWNRGTTMISPAGVLTS